jgi:hypothetical protein
MYQAFRDGKQNLPGDEEILKTQKPSVKVYLYPFKSDQPNARLPKLAATQLILQPILNIETLKKYLAMKFESAVKPEEISIMYKNIELQDHFTLKDVEKLYQFSEKNIFHYMKKTSIIDNKKTEPNKDNDIIMK